MSFKECWEQAAGHMPKDADFNAGEGKGVEPVNARDNVLSTSGAINVLGNVWEWDFYIKTSKRKCRRL
ncbi:Uncharacterised protein [Helicobacter fennelliae]|uniref:Sulfatase-modifying factor enzyme domain-containing protein n=2 Tax=Helicobacter fennelliae TaxID=215 RepID=A0A2X3DYM9_9HELI|nr:Uncharacterised protein [Helicobacter fennelliae]